MQKTAFALILSLFCGVALRAASPAPTQTAHFEVNGKAVTYELLDAGPHAPLVILLPGTSGPDVPYYRDRAAVLQKGGFTVLLLHFFDASRTHDPSDDNYRSWVAALEQLVHVCGSDPALSNRPIALVGFSLGASIALAAGSQRIPVAGIAEWYGSLPDTFFEHLQGMPPLLILHGSLDRNIPVSNATQLLRLCQIKSYRCDSHLYPDQEHGFMGKSLEDADARTLAFLADLLRSPPQARTPSPLPPREERRAQTHAAG